MTLMRGLALSVALSLAASACASGRTVARNRPIEAIPGVLGHSFRQDGEPVGRIAVLDALSDTPEGRDRLRSAGACTINGFLFLDGAIGAGLAATQTSGRASAALAGGGVVAAAFSAFLLWRADAHVARAVDEYNLRVAPPPVTDGNASRAPSPAPGFVHVGSVVVAF